MNDNLKALLDNIKNDCGKTINYLIKCNVLSIRDIVFEVLKSKNAEYIYFVSRYVDGAPIEKLADAIIETGNAEYIYYFAMNVSDAPIEKLSDAIIKIGVVDYIYYFAKNVSDAPIEKLANAIIKSGNAKLICDFARDVADAPIEKLMDAILLTHNMCWIHKFKETIILKADVNEGDVSLEYLLELVENEDEKQINENLVEFSNLFNDNRNIYRLHYVKFDDDKNINCPYIPFMLPDNMTRGEAFLVISYLNEQIEKDFDFCRGQWYGVTRTNNMLEQYHFKMLPEDEVCVDDITTLYTADGNFERFRESEFYEDYFEWFTPGVDYDCIKKIYEKVA